MPTYTYKCDNGHVFDWWQTMMEPPLVNCEKCMEAGEEELVPVHRQIGAGGGVIWKGGPPTRRFGR